MQYKEYITVCNFTRLSKFYGLHNLNIGSYATWTIRTLNFLEALIELEDDNKYPDSIMLDSIIEFVENNKTACKLRQYLDTLPGIGYQNKKIYVTKKADENHAYLMHCIQSIQWENMSEFGGKSEFFLMGHCRVKTNNESTIMNIKIDDIVIKIEKNSNLKDKSFIVNDLLLHNIEFNELVNFINYASVVKKLTIENTQAAYYFLR
jgi:hypothetical protein